MEDMKGASREKYYIYDLLESFICDFFVSEFISIYVLLNQLYNLSYTKYIYLFSSCNRKQLILKKIRILFSCL